MSEKALQPVEQRQVEFYGDELTAVQLEDGTVYVSVRHMCDALGLAQRAQVLRIKRNEILADGYKGAIMMITPGGPQRAGMLRVDLIPLWLAGLELSRVNDDIRPKLSRFQREAAKVLWQAFQEGRLTADPTLDELLQQDTPEAQAYRLAQAVLKMARTQLLMRSQLEDHERRLEYLEDRLDDPGRHVTPDQAMQISQAVKTVALAIGKKSGRNEFGAVYGEMYRRFGITSYKMLPAGKFEAALAWLTDWYQSVTGATGDDVPF